MRLESFFYKTLQQDLQIITYNHARALLASKAPTSIQPISQKNHTYNIFSTDISSLPTRPLTSTTSYIASLPQKPVKKPWQRPVRNVLFGKCEDKQDIVQVYERTAPLTLKKIKLKVYTEVAITNKQALLSAIMSLTQITSEKAYPLFAERGDAARKLREGMCIGCEVELTGSSMYTFLDKLIHTVLPRIREWQGMNTCRIGDGLQMTLDKSAIGYFSDVEPFFDMYPGLFDTQISFTTNGENAYEDALVLSGLGFPLLKTPVVPVKVDEAAVDAKNDPYAMYKTVERRKVVAIVGTPIRKRIKN